MVAAPRCAACGVDFSAPLPVRLARMRSRDIARDTTMVCQARYAPACRTYCPWWSCARSARRPISWPLVAHTPPPLHPPTPLCHISAPSITTTARARTRARARARARAILPTCLNLKKILIAQRELASNHSSHPAASGVCHASARGAFRSQLSTTAGQVHHDHRMAAPSDTQRRNAASRD